MKKLFIGRKSQIVAANIALGIISLLFVFVLIAPNLNIEYLEINKIGFIALSLFILVVIVIVIIQYVKDEELCSYVLITENQISLKRFGRVLQNYDLTKINISYSAWVKSGVIYPCLIISPKEYYSYTEYLGYNHQVDYFTIILNKRRWQILSNWYKKEIRVPIFSEIYLDMYGKENIDKFFKVVCRYNMEIKRNEKTGVIIE